jgi:glutamyl-Q tRNA(Asp) synthetase
VSSCYIGRFAPSPTGALHLGSLLAAVGSYADARHHGGRWLVRIEDVDKTRSVQGADRLILATLNACGIRWDGEVSYQSQRDAVYQAALDSLGELVYPCNCSRKKINTPVYPGYCRNGADAQGRKVYAWRLRVTETVWQLTDLIQGDYQQNLVTEVGDFVLKRVDGLYAYQLAVVVDDAAQGVTRIVRGADLLDNTPRQIYLQRVLGYATPSYAHLPILRDADGNKLSKQTCAPAVDNTQALHLIWHCLNLLGQQPPAELRRTTLNRLWEWTFAHWDIRRVPVVRSVSIN